MRAARGQFLSWLRHQIDRGDTGAKAVALMLVSMEARLVYLHHGFYVFISARHFSRDIKEVPYAG